MTEAYRFDDVIADPDESYPVELDLYSLAAVEWTPNEKVSLGEFARPRLPNGFSYEVMSAGTTGSKEPFWPKTLGETVTDGSVTWACRAAGSNGINAVTSPSCTSDPTGMTIASISLEEDRKIFGTYSGGVLGQTYDAVWSFTLNGRTRIARQRVNWRKQ